MTPVNVLPEPLMSKAVEHLRAKAGEATVQYLKDLHARDPEWGDELTAAQHKENKAKYGFSIPYPFHFGTGMSIRNCLREVIRDEELPGVYYEDDQREYRNWDDWYTSVVERLIGVG
jgi:hypothetical protein